MTRPVQIFIILASFLPIAFRWNNRLHACIESIGNNLIGVISPIRQQRFCVNAFDQMDSFFTICSGTFCNNNSDWHTMRIHGQMYLGVEPPFVFAMA